MNAYPALANTVAVVLTQSMPFLVVAQEAIRELSVKTKSMNVLQILVKTVELVPKL
jgi:hypothetical protein